MVSTEEYEKGYRDTAVGRAEIRSRFGKFKAIKRRAVKEKFEERAKKIIEKQEKKEMMQKQKLATQLKKEKTKLLKKERKGLGKSYKALEKAIRGKKPKKPKESAKLRALKRKLAELKGVKLRRVIERKRVNILAKVEDKIPSTIIKKEPEKKSSFLGRGGLI